MPISPPIKRALVSVSDKQGLSEFIRELVALDIEIFSTGGTRKHLESAGIQVRDVADYTGFPEMMDGRVKTLHPKVHGGLLCRHDNPSDMASLAEHGIATFELVVVNLYPFEETIARPGVTPSEAIEQIDIGGPSMVRSAAKNHAFVTLATNPEQYGAILAEIRDQGTTTLETRRQLAGAAFARTAEYDTAIAGYFVKLNSVAAGVDDYPPQVRLELQRRDTLRYGENPHQSAALYAFPSAPTESLVNAEQLNGKELSYNNLLDLDAALAIARSLPQPGVAVLKHNNPCGAATAETLAEAASKAWDGDPLSAFGSVLGVNVPVDGPMAEFLAEPGRFVEAIVAPDFTPEALEVLTTKPKWKANVRLLKTGTFLPGMGAQVFRQIDGGMLCQTADDLPDETSAWQVLTEAKPSAELQADLEFAWAVCRFVKSNAIVLTKDKSLLGVGAGQMSRVDSVEIAIRKAGKRCQGSVLASDAFFPFEDSIQEAANAGIAAIIQPGGSRRDAEVIAACNEYGLPMIFTGTRHFRH
ncbi:bifunctional phosphoribosylaminoimidazolecarboxamide formyltransferase/IMP cyclohydrolase [Bythopirellula polymerisocia]|uniref:Bifunctional purine biosynthesis protein PurH n=1 Tax=Bythopirellula polymerisocia TaxID=2528003 RepID=A0A5C6D2H7_9BACT|nr:bifunctional phosphoribosylaminoimidazolecarboxamide formyltransferase/IMP cyclohydrolase [Bythopirellula polymerisocia]TWU30054.1 Bifunctional purine biosynthesis protein PurH [Bythopirellula polymerisocia]